MSSQHHQSQSELVCPNCLAPIRADDDFCPNCDVPLTVHATTDPISNIRAGGYAYASAANRPRSRLVVIGVWLLFGNLFIVNLPVVYYSLSAMLAMFIPIQGVSTDHGFFPVFFVFLLAIAVETMFVAVIVKVTRNYRKSE